VTADDPRALYSLPLDDFIRSRNSLAKQLADAGDTEGAARVKALRKPNVTAWAVNQLVAANPEGIKRLQRATEQLRGASNAAELRTATTARNRIIAELADEAGGVLSSAGHGFGPAQREKLIQTIQVGSSEQIAEFEAGTLTRDLEPSGFGDFGGFPDLYVVEDDTPGAEAAEAKRKADDLAAAADELNKDYELLDLEALEAEKTAGALRRKAERARRKHAAARERAAAAAEKAARLDGRPDSVGG
jgi:hypothetical protein